MNLRLHEAILKYERNSNLYSANSQYEFLELFESPSTPVYCDLMGMIARSQQMEVGEYVRVLSNMQIVESKIKQVKKGESVYKDNEWITNVTFEKTLDYLDNNGVWFSSEEYYGEDFHINVEFAYNPEEDRCYIKGIQGSMSPGKKHLPNKFWVIEKQDGKNRDKLLVKSPNTSSTGKSGAAYEPVKYNTYNQAFIDYEARNVVCRNDNEHISIKKTRNKHIKATAENYELVNLQFKTTNWRVKPRFAFAVGGIYKVSSAVTFTEQKSSASEFGVDFGYTFSLGRSTQFGLFAGVALQKSKISFALNGMTYSYTVHKYDPDNGSNFNEEDMSVDIVRYYNGLSATEGIDYNNLVLPAYIAFDHKFGKALAFTWSVGAKFYFNQATNVQPYTITGSVTQNGVSSSINQEFNQFLYPSYYNPDNSISLVGGAGFNINLFRSALFLSIKANYEFGLGNVHSSDENYLYDRYSSMYPLIYSTESNKDIATRSFMDCVSFKRQAIWFEGGLMLKF